MYQVRQDFGLNFLAKAKRLRPRPGTNITGTTLVKALLKTLLYTTSDCKWNIKQDMCTTDSRKQRNTVILGLYQNDRITTVCQNVRIFEK